MRVAVISGSYRPGYSYQENIWTERLAARGHAVRVFAPRRRRPEPETDPIERVPTLGLAARHLYHTRALAPAVRRFAPALILWFGPPQRFGVDVARDPALARVPLVAFFGENRAMQPFERAATARDRLRALAYRLARGPAVALACRRAARVVATTPETPAILRALLPPGLSPPIITAPLGFDPRAFGPDPARRRSPDGDVIAVVSSRFAPEKAATLRFVIDALDRAMTAAPPLRALIVGFDDGPISRAIAARIEASPHAARYARRPFADRPALAAAFHHADLAVFARPSISAQEALATGLYAILADGAMGWLLADEHDGALYPPGDRDALVHALVAATARLAAEPPEARDAARDARAARAARLGYDRVIDHVLAGLLTG